MDKLISSAEAFKVLSEYYHHRTPQQAEALLEALQRVPEAVVRCKDCVKARHEIYANSEVWLCDCYNVSHVCEANDYCSYGERRNDE